MCVWAQAGTVTLSDAAATEHRIAVVASYDELIDAIRTRKAELGLSDATVDSISGLAAGHTGKLLGPAQVKTLGKVSMGLLLQALGLVLVVVEDPAQTEKMRAQYAQREGHQVREGNNASPVSKRLISRVFGPFARQGGIARMRKLSAKERSDLARKAARKRWVKPARGRRQ